jgi:polyketide synthase PksN
VRGEGVGAVLLKPLRKAVADRDYIYAVIRGSALNHDGKSYSLIAPNPAAQAEVVLKAHREAGIDPATVSYIEAQGTGLPLADPIELDAFKTAFNALCREWGIGESRPACGIGYLKPSIGHLECASGIAALLKLLWALKTRQIPGVKNVDAAAAKRYLEDSPFYVVASNQPWEARPDRGGRLAPRRAGLHSFGFGGVNAHLVLEEYPDDGEARA